MPLVNMGLQRSVEFDRLELEDTATYWASIEAMDGAGLFTFTTSPFSVTIDVSKPEPAVVEMHNLGGPVPPPIGQGDAVQTRADMLCMSWTEFGENSSSIVVLEAAFGTVPFGEQVSPYRPLLSVLQRDADAVAALAQTRTPDEAAAWSPVAGSAGGAGTLCLPLELP